MKAKKKFGAYLQDFENNDLFPPGEALKDYLIELYPATKNSFVSQMDNDFSADGELTDLIYESSIYYLIRRLVTTAEFIHRKTGENLLTTRSQLKSHLDDTTRFSSEQLNTLVKLLIPCLETARDDFSEGDKNFVKKQAKNNRWNCYVCGKEMKGEYVETADHLWPRTMGGLSNRTNLRMVCQHCNNKYKKDNIGPSDYHYEEIAISLTDYKHYLATKQPKWFEIAIFTKSDFQCEVCSQPAYRVGELFVGRKDLSSGWHYLNLTAYCFNHKPE